MLSQGQLTDPGSPLTPPAAASELARDRAGGDG
jgi:hypothetical protein